MSLFRRLSFSIYSQQPENVTSAVDEPASTFVPSKQPDRTKSALRSKSMRKTRSRNFVQAAMLKPKPSVRFEHSPQIHHYLCERDPSMVEIPICTQEVAVAEASITCEAAVRQRGKGIKWAKLKTVRINVEVERITYTPHPAELAETHIPTVPQNALVISMKRKPTISTGKAAKNARRALDKGVIEKPEYQAFIRRLRKEDTFTQS